MMITNDAYSSNNGEDYYNNFLPIISNNNINLWTLLNLIYDNLELLNFQIIDMYIIHNDNIHRQATKAIETLECCWISEAKNISEDLPRKFFLTIELTVFHFLSFGSIMISELSMNYILASE